MFRQLYRILGMGILKPFCRSAGRTLCLTIAGAAAFCHGAESHGGRTWLLDVGGCGEGDEMYLIEVLQGLVNRDRPRLFLNHSSPFCAGAGNVFARFLEREKGIAFTRCHGLAEAIAMFAKEKRADGSPLIRGLVRYGTPDSRWYMRWIAANLAAQEDLLPVTDELLKGGGPLLGHRDRWFSTDSEMRGWAEFFATATPTSSGLRITAGEDAYRCAHMESYRNRWVELDLDATPRLEVTVTDVAPGSRWGVVVDLGSTIDTFANPQGTVVTRDRTDTGTFVFDLKASGHFDPSSGRASIKLCAMTPKGSFTVKSVRLLRSDGSLPSAPTQSPGSSWAQGLPMIHDLLDERSFPDVKNEESACAWALREQLPRCTKDEVLFIQGHTLNALDRAVAKKAFAFYQPLTPYADAFPNLDVILGQLKPPALVSGWLKDEPYYIRKVGSFGHRQAWLCENLSFWQHIAADAKVRLPQVRAQASLKKSIYVNFSGASGDVVLQPSGLMSHLWQDPARGTVPVTWGLNPCLAQLAPAMVEYFARTASPRDSFWAGPSGSGYTSPDAMTSSELAAYAAVTRRDMQQCGLSPAIDLWDSNVALQFDRINRAFTTPAAEMPIGLFTPCVWNDPRNKLNYWMDDGTPVIFPDRSLFSLWEEPLSGIDCASETAMARDIARRIIGVADRVAESPFFLTLNIRWSARVLALVAAQLPPERFTVVGMPDFIALAQEAGSFAVNAPVVGTAGGGPAAIDLMLRNPGTATLQAGRISWHLPEGWRASEDSWSYANVSPHAVESKRITLTAPAGFTSGEAIIRFADTRVPAVERRVVLSGYARSRLITAGRSVDGWMCSGGAQIGMDEGRATIKPAVIAKDFWKKKAPEQNGQVRLALGKIDMERNPVLEIDLADNCGKTRILVDDGSKAVQVVETDIPGRTIIDLRAKTAWRGDQDLAVLIAPGVTWGYHVRLGSIAVHER